MNIEVIREALELAREVVDESVRAHPEFDSLFERNDRTEADVAALAQHYSQESGFYDCKALVAVDRALKALDAKEGA